MFKLQANLLYRFVISPFVLSFTYATATIVVCHKMNFYPSIPWQVSLALLVVFLLKLLYFVKSYQVRRRRVMSLWTSIIEKTHAFRDSVKGLFGDDDKQGKELLKRQLAWLLVLCEESMNKESLDHDILQVRAKSLLADKELVALCKTSSISGQILRNQANRLQSLQSEGRLTARSHMNLFHQLSDFYKSQMQTENLVKTTCFGQAPFFVLRFNSSNPILS